MNLLKVLNSLSDVNTSNMKNICTVTIQSTLEYGAVTFGMMAPCNIDRLHASQNQWVRLILGVPQGRSARMMKHKLQLLPVEHRAKLCRAKLYRNIIGNTNHPLPTTINRKQRNEWTTEIQECHRLASRQMEKPTQLQRDDTAPWEQLPYECRTDWTREGTEILKHIHHQYAPSVTSTHTTHIISSTAPTYAPHCRPWICGQTPPE